MVKLKKFLLGIVLCFIAMLVINPLQVQAKNPSLVKLKLGKTYKKYDVTGDKENDKIKVAVQKSDKYGLSYKIYISINGKKYTLKRERGFYDIESSIVTLKNGKTYLEIQGYCESDSDPFMNLYQYKGGKLVKVFTLRSEEMESPVISDKIVIEEVSGNTITVKKDAMSSPLGIMGYSCKYVYRNGKIVKKSNIGKILWVKFDNDKQSRTGVLRNTKTLYSSIAFKRKVTSIKAGQKATVTEIYSTKNKISVKLKARNGKSGWVKCSKNYDDRKLIFKHCFYAG